MRIGEIGIQVQSPLIFRNCLGVLALIGIKIAQLQMSLGEVLIQRDRLLEQ